MTQAQGLISGRGGLPCRSGDGCEVVFHAGRTTQEIVEAAKLRNMHEVKVHGYLHKAVNQTSAKDFKNIDFNGRRANRRQNAMLKTW